MPLAQGQILHNRYRIVHLLGQGGFGAVYRAWDLHLKVHRALKENLDTSPVAQALFAQEASLLSRLSHPNLPEVYDHFSESGQGQYLVMAYVEGQDLKEKLDQAGGPLPEGQVLGWVLQVISALEYLHSRQPAVIHRDVKPSNIRITPQGQAVLVDFGIARPYDPAAVTSASARPVSPGYSPIEQYGRQAADARSDVYALGATLYTLLTGQVPPESIARYGGTALVEPWRVNPAVTPGVEWAVLRAMEIQGDRRFQTVGELRAALLSRARLVLPARLDKWLLAGGVLIVLLLGLGAGGWALGWFAAPRAASQAGVAGGVSAPGPAAAGLTTTPAAGRAAQVTSSPGAAATLPPLVFPSPTPSPAWTPAPTPTPLPLGPLLPAPREAISPQNAPRVAMLARLGKGRLNDMAIAPGGDYLVAATSIGLYLYDTETLAELRFIPESIGIREIAFAPDGERMAAIHEDWSLQMWRLQDWTPQPLAESQNSYPMCLEFSPDGQTLAVCNLSNIELRSAADGRLLRTLNSEGAQQDQSPSFSPDGKLLASTGNGKVVDIWQMETGNRLQTLQSEVYIKSLAFSPDGKWLVVSATQSLELWQTSDWSLVKTLESSWGETLAFSPDGQLLAVGTTSSAAWGTIKIYTVPGGSPVVTLDGLISEPLSIVFTSDSQVLVSAADDGALRAWSLPDGQPLAVTAGFTSGIFSLVFSPDGQYLATGADEPYGRAMPVAVWRVADGALMYYLGDHEGNSQNQVAFSPGGETLAISFGELYLELRRTSDGRLLRTLPGQEGMVTGLDFAPDGAALAVGMFTGQVQMWDAADGKLLRSFAGHSNIVRDLVFSPDGAVLASLSLGEAISLWRAGDGSLIHQFTGPNGGTYTGMAFSPDGEVLVTAGFGVDFWQVSSGNRLRTIDDVGSGFSSVQNVAVSPDGKILALAYIESVPDSRVAIELRATADGSLLASLQGHTGMINRLAFSPDGGLLASGSTDGTIILWGVAP